MFKRMRQKTLLGAARERPPGSQNRPCPLYLLGGASCGRFLRASTWAGPTSSPSRCQPEAPGAAWVSPFPLDLQGLRGPWGLLAGNE